MRLLGVDRLSIGKVFALYIGFVFLGGSLLAPWAYWGVHSLSTVVAVPNSILSSPFHRYVNRMCLFIAIAGLVPLWRRVEGHSATGLWGCFPRERCMDYWRGCRLGFLSLACLAGIVMAAGGRDVNTAMSPQSLAIHCLNAGLSALVVGFLEEILFRGVLFRGLCKQYSFATSAGVSSALYASLHFFHRPESPPLVEWWTGIQTLAAMGSGFVDLKLFLPSFANFFLAGLILVLMFRVTGGLWFSAGLHAGWIFWLKSYGRLTVPTAGAEGWFWGTSRFIDSWLATTVLLVVGAACWIRWRKGASYSLPNKGGM